MPNLWDDWERRVLKSGESSRLAQELTDEELLTLLTAAEARSDPAQLRVLKQETLDRLHRAHRADRGDHRELAEPPSAYGMPPGPPAAPAAGPDPPDSRFEPHS